MRIRTARAIARASWWAAPRVHAYGDDLDGEDADGLTLDQADDPPSHGARGVVTGLAGIVAVAFAVWMLVRVIEIAAALLLLVIDTVELTDLPTLAIVGAAAWWKLNRGRPKARPVLALHAPRRSRRLRRGRSDSQRML